MGSLIYEFEQGTGVLIGVVDTRTLDDARGEAVQRINAAYDAALAGGFADPTTGIRIAIGDSDRQLFDQYDSQLARKGAPDGYLIPLIDADGVQQTITVVQFRGLITRAGDYFASLFFKRGALCAAAQQAVSIEVADAIQW